MVFWGMATARKGGYANRENPAMGDRGVQSRADSGISKGKGLSSQDDRGS